MNNLSINRVLAAAPAVAKRKDADREGLIDTTQFLRFARRQGFLPVLAVQGSGHDDSAHAKEKNGRHLVIAARPTTAALFLLNSHTKDRRAHIGIGWWKDDGFLIGPSTPVQRWLGYEDVIEDLTRNTQDLGRTTRALQDWIPDEQTVRLLARTMSRRGYMAGVVNRPAWQALVENIGNPNAKELGFEIIRRMREGNLAAIDGGRRIKGVRRPDGLFHAAMVCWHQIVAAAQTQGKVDKDFDLPALDERLVRP